MAGRAGITGTLRAKILDDARQAVTADRQATHGRPEDTFAAIAEFWGVYLNGIRDPATGWVEVAPHDVAAMLALLKIARLMANHEHEDNWTDLAGYAACGAELAIPLPLAVKANKVPE